MSITLYAGGRMQTKASQLCLFVSFASRLTGLAYRPEKVWWNYFWSSIFISKEYYWNKMHKNRNNRGLNVPWNASADLRWFVCWLSTPTQLAGHQLRLVKEHVYRSFWYSFSGLKFGKFQNEFMKSSFLPKYEQKKFHSYFGRNDDFINSLWNLLPFKMPHQKMISLHCAVLLSPVKAHIFR